MQSNEIQIQRNPHSHKKNNGSHKNFVTSNKSRQEKIVQVQNVALLVKLKVKQFETKFKMNQSNTENYVQISRTYFIAHTQKKTDSKNETIQSATQSTSTQAK